MTDSGRRVFDAFTGLIPIRVVVPLLLAIFVFIAISWGYVRNRHAVEASIEQESVRDLHLDLTRLQAALEEAAQSGNVSWMQEQLAAFGADTHGLVALLADESGIVMASSRRRELGRTVDEVLPDSFKGTDVFGASSLARIQATRIGSVQVVNDRKAVAGTYPVLLGAEEGALRPNRVGLVLVARDLTKLKSQERVGSRQETLHLGLVLLATGMATSLLLHWLVTRRLARISKAADRLAAGDLTARSGVSGRDEIALLGKSFDSMVIDLERHEAALIASEERHRSLFLHAVEGIVTMGEDRLIQSINPAAQKLFGYSEAEVLGKNVKVLMPSPYHEEHDGYVRNYVQTGKKKIIGIGREVIGRRKDGSTFPLELSVVELKLKTERVFTGILRDITDRKRAEDELQQINENLEKIVRERTQALEDAQESLMRQERMATLGQLAGSVAHEVRNPLGIVRNAAYYLQQTAKEPDPDSTESFQEIQRGLKRIDGIIGELLDYARDPQSNHQEFALQDAVNFAFDGIDVPQGVTIHCSKVEPTLMCYGDADQISRVLNNLIVNGIQAMPEGGELLVRCISTDPSRVMVEVQDSGIGMSREELSKVFEPLFTTKTRGIGLGLALSLRYAELNNASLTVESSLGEGSTFRLTIPIIADA